MLDAGYALFLQQIRKVYEAAVHHADVLGKKLSPPTDSKEGKQTQVGLCSSLEVGNCLDPTSAVLLQQVELSDLPTRLHNLKDDAIAFFEQHAQASLVPGVSWKYDSERQVNPFYPFC
jgi:hypothetical protein